MRVAKRSIKFLLLMSLVAVFFSQTAIAFINGDQTVTYGSVIRLRHKKSNRRLESKSEVYPHWRTRGRVAVYVTGQQGEWQYWVIKGPHSGDRWNCQLGQPVKKGDQIRLENLKKKENLHSWGLQSYPPEHYTVIPNGKNGIGDYNDSWRVKWVSDGSRGVVLNGSAITLQHVRHGRFLHSGIHWFKDEGRFEVTAYTKQDENSHWVVELVHSPAQNNITKDAWQADRGSVLEYNKPIWIDPVSTGDENFQASPPKGVSKKPGHELELYWNNRRLWTHDGSRHDEKRTHKEPHRHEELLGGPWSDGRCKGQSSWFMIQNVDNPSQQGAVQYGQKIKILSLARSNRLLSPFKTWWSFRPSRWGAAHDEIVVSHPDLGSVKTNQGHFVIEAVMPGVGGNIHQHDVVQIRNLARNKRVLWLHLDSRFGSGHSEILGNNNDDPWAVKHWPKNHRNNIWHRFRFHHVRKDWVPSWAQADYDKVGEEIAEFLGLELAKRKAEEEAKRRQEAEARRKKAEEEVRKLKQELQRTKDDEKRKLQEAEALRKRLVAEAARRGPAEKAKVQKEMDEYVNNVQNQIDKDQSDALKALQESMKKMQEDNAKKVLALQQQLLDVQERMSMPIGFVKVQGAASQVALGRKKVLIGEKRVATPFAWGIDTAGKLMQWNPQAQFQNPWYVHEAVDEDDSPIDKFKSVAIGNDGATYAVAADGQVYRYNWPGEDQTPEPRKVRRKRKKRKKRRKRRRRRKRKKRRRKKRRRTKRAAKR